MELRRQWRTVSVEVGFYKLIINNTYIYLLETWFIERERFYMFY